MFVTQFDINLIIESWLVLLRLAREIRFCKALGEPRILFRFPFELHLIAQVSSIVLK